MARKSKVDFTTGEILEEVEARVAHILDSRRIFRHPFHRVSVRLPVNKPSMTHQAHAESCDINSIIRQFDRTGVLPPAAHQPIYADVSDLNRDLTELLSDSSNVLDTYARDLAAAQAEAAAAAANSSSEAPPASSSTGDKPAPPPAGTESA